ncbi:hypothetical protein H072_287 [Dactylellina haptotyla CBS 200.50]|uniref:Uncharacterized protein n=1 Tax=Dactylellina haptotyla (strain CBS 200.50) TaxID=1284197 RepID=S8CDX9_DACHA|nr:hypothetical protein H072_287 [Dactylellina haptotyla CBS 200.50]
MVRIFSKSAIPAILGAYVQLASSLVIPGIYPPSQSQPNPIVEIYGPLPVTATINSTFAIVPIPLSEARARIPAQYGILTAAYQELLPGWPSDMYPLVVTSALEHDIHGFGIIIPDFTTFRLSFPFVDLLNDGYSNFVYAPVNWMNANVVGILGLTVYGLFTPASTMDPPSDPYAFVPAAQASAPGQVYFNFTEIGGGPNSPTGYVKYTPSGTVDVPWDFVRNVTNQPFTGNGIICDNQIRIFNTRLTQPPFSPIPVSGSVFLDSALYSLKINTNTAKGWLFAAAFLENNFIPCPLLKGYNGAGNS